MANAWGNSWGASESSGGGYGGAVGFIAEGLSRALLIVSDGKEELLQYATSAGGSFVSLVGFVIHQDLLAEPNFDENSRAPTQTRRAYCKGPVTPALAIGYQIKDNTQSPPLVWAVEGVIFECQQIATLSRQERVLFSGPDRGASA
jgi:hypothetical protein